MPQNKLEKSVCRLPNFSIQLLSCWENFLPRLDAEISNEKKKAVTSVYHAFLTADLFPKLLNTVDSLFCQKRKEAKPFLSFSSRIMTGRHEIDWRIRSGL
jgi:hypothetical protein